VCSSDLVSQLGYITLGVALVDPEAMAGGLVHLVNHAFMKIVLFFCAGIIITVTGRTKISQLDGIGRVMPRTMGCFTLAALGMVGVPPVCGYVSKWYLLRGAVHAEQWPVVLVLVGSSFLNAAYFFPIVIRAFLRPYRKDVPGLVNGAHGGHGGPGGPGGHDRHGGHAVTAAGGASPVVEAPATMLWPVMLIALVTVALGVWSAVPLNFIQALVRGL